MKDMVYLARIGAQTMASMLSTSNGYAQRSFSSEYARRLASRVLDDAVEHDDGWLRRKQRLLSLKGAAVLQVDTEHEWIDSVSCLRVKPKGKKCARKVIYFHGGGYVVGSARSYHYTYAKVALALDAEVIGIDYSLCPEHSVTTLSDEALRVYDVIQACETPAQLLLMGDSAGGGAVLSLGTRLVARGAMPDNVACVLISPWVDPLDPSLLDQSKESGDLLNKAILAKWHNALAATEGYEEWVRFLDRDWEGFPPTYIQAAGAEMFLPQVDLLASQMKSAGVKVDYSVFPGQFHVFQTLAPLVREADDAWRKLSESLAMAAKS